MIIKGNLKKYSYMIMAIVMFITALPIYSFANATPWEPYSQYLPWELPVVKRHLRGVWISTVLNLDWPSVAVRRIEADQERIQKSKEELIGIFDKAVEMNMNAVFFQVSPEGDALYPSNIVPWSRYLTGTFGKDPGFDPLAFAIEEARKRNLEFHAWFNPYRISMNTNGDTIASLEVEKSVFKEHPEWIKSAMSRFVVDPGVPEAREWVISRVMEVLENYDVDGIHFDDYFYYERYVGELEDQDTFSQYNQGQFSNLGDWRRNNTYLLVKELSNKIRATKPWVKFGISPAGVWANQRDGHPSGSNTRAGLPNFDRSFADTKKWVEEEIIDYIAPQIYFSFANPGAPYGEVAHWWSRVVKGRNVHLYIGQGLYKVNDNADPYFQGANAVEEFRRQLTFNTVKPEIMGSIMFRFQNLHEADKQVVVEEMKNRWWSTKALVPPMPWKGGKAPDPPIQGRMEGTSGGIKLSWVDNSPHTSYFAIYRMEKGGRIDIHSKESGAKLIATLGKTGEAIQGFIDREMQDPKEVTYAITALDRLHHESSPLIIDMDQSIYFYDVGREYAWAIDPIDTFYERGIVYGDGRGYFRPGENTKRGDFILMVVRALQLEAPFQNPFEDVPKTSYYYDAIGIARALGIVKGNGTSFNPNGNITREDMMVIMARTLERVGINLEEGDQDFLRGYHDENQISDYARKAVASLTKAGLIQGDGDRVRPKHQATRAEIAVVLYRLLNTIEQKTAL